MKKKVLALTLATVMAASSLVACGKNSKETSEEKTAEVTAASTEEATESKSAENASMADPWEQTDKDGVAAIIGVEFVEIDAAVNPEYFVCKSLQEAEMDFVTEKYPDVKFFVRAKKSDSLEDTTGLSVKWESEEDVKVGNVYDGVLKYVVTPDENNNTYAAVMFYDPDHKLSYSVFAVGQDASTVDDLSALAAEVCGVENKEDNTAEEETTADNTGMANPWEQTEKDGVAAVIGVEFTEIDAAVNPEYFVCKDLQEAEMDFVAEKYPNVKFFARAKKSTALEDTTGLSVKWESEEDVKVGNIYDGVLKYVVTPDENNNTYAAVMFYDQDHQLSYSVFAVGENAFTVDDLSALAAEVCGVLNT